METEQVVYKAEMPDGSKITIRKDKTHYRAFSADGKQVGEAWIKLSSLQDELKFKIFGEQGAGTDQGQQGAGSEPEQSTEAPGEKVGQEQSGDQPAAGADQSNHDRSRCGHFKEEVCQMDNTACDGQCGEHASRATADKKEGQAE